MTICQGHMRNVVEFRSPILLLSFILATTILFALFCPQRASSAAVSPTIKGFVSTARSTGYSTKALPLGQSAAPALQGATNGTIGPQGYDGAYLTGITAVNAATGSNESCPAELNNLANLEAFLSMVGDASEVLGLSWGVTMIIYSVVKQSTVLAETVATLTIGSASVFCGLASPSLINWLIYALRS